MRTHILSISLLMFAILTCSLPAAAHHGNAAFENSKLLSVKANVTGWIWANPHCIMRFDVKDQNNNVVHWTAELNNPPEMVRNGWSKQSLKIGDEVTVFMVQAKNGNPVGRVQKVVLANGQVLVAMANIGTNQQETPGSSDEPKR